MDNFKVLEKLQSMNAKYYKNFEALLGYYGPILNTGALVREVGYTPHDAEIHCANIYRILSDILPDKFYQKYEYGENLFLLVIGVLLHDYAMALDVTDQTRGEHSEIGKKEVIQQIYSSEHTVMKANISRDYAEYLGDIIYAHSDIKNENNEIIRYTLQEIVEKYNKKGISKGKHEPINVPYLAAVLRLADELDLDYNRISMVGYEQKYNTIESKSHFEKCELFKKVEVNPKNSSELLLEVDAHVFESFDESKKQTAAAQIIKTYEKVSSEFRQMKSSILFNILYASEIWFIESISLRDEEVYREYVEKKKN